MRLSVFFSAAVVHVAVSVNPDSNCFRAWTDLLTYISCSSVLVISLSSVHLSAALIAKHIESLRVIVFGILFEHIL